MHNRAPAWCKSRPATKPYLEARRCAGGNKLNVARDCVLADTRLKPVLPELQASAVDADARAKVIDAAEDDADRACKKEV